jgi:hypothetical protein
LCVFRAPLPCEPQLFKRNRSAFFNWYELNKTAYTHYISSNYNSALDYPSFINGNGKYRLIMNGILLQHGYLIANIKADEDTRELYYKILKASITKENKEDLIRFCS